MTKDHTNGGQPNSLAAFTIMLLSHEDHYLLLRRSQAKRFAPGRWTGVGGSVEPDEHNDLRASALRELQEETGITERSVDQFALRRVLLHARPGGPLTVLLYFTGSLNDRVTPDCSEGTLTWVKPDQLSELDVIETSGPVLPMLIDDQKRDAGQPLSLGIARYHDDGAFDRIIWA